MAEMLNQGHALVERSAARRWLNSELSSAAGELTEEQWLPLLRRGLLESSDAAADALGEELVRVVNQVGRRGPTLLEALRQLLPSVQGREKADVVGRLAILLLSSAENCESAALFGVALALGPEQVVTAAISSAVRLLTYSESVQSADHTWQLLQSFLSEILRGCTSTTTHCLLRGSLGRSVSSIQHDQIAVLIANRALSVLSMYSGPEKMGPSSSWVADVIGYGVDVASVSLIVDLVLSSAIERDEPGILETFTVLMPWSRTLVILAVKRLGPTKFAWASSMILVNSLSFRLGTGIRAFSWSVEVLSELDEGIHPTAFLMLGQTITLLGAVAGTDEAVTQSVFKKLNIIKPNFPDELLTSPIHLHNYHAAKSFASVFLIGANVFHQVQIGWPEPAVLAVNVLQYVSVLHRTNASVRPAASLAIITQLCVCLSHKSECLRLAAARGLALIPEKGRLLIFLPLLLKIMSTESSSDVALEILNGISSCAVDGPSSLPVVSLLCSLIPRSAALGDYALLSLTGVASRVPLVAFAPLARLLDSRFKKWGLCSPDEQAVIASNVLLVTSNRPSKGSIFVPVIQQTIVSARDSPLAASLGLRTLEVLCSEGVLDPRVALKLVFKNFAVSPEELCKIDEFLRLPLISCFRCASRISTSAKGAVIAKKCIVTLRTIVEAEFLSPNVAAVAADALRDYTSQEVLAFESNDDDDPTIVDSNLEEECKFISTIFRSFSLKVDKKNTESLTGLLVLLTETEWTNRLRNAFADDKLRKLRMTSAALQRARAPTGDRQASTPLAATKTDFMEYVSFLPKGVVRRVTEIASEILSEDPKSRLRGIRAVEVLVRANALTSGLPWGKLLLVFFKKVVPELQEAGDVVDLSPLVNAVFLLPSESSGTLPFVLTTSSGGCLREMPLSSLMTVAQRIIEKDQSGLVDEFFNHCLNGGHTAAICSGLEASITRVPRGETTPTHPSTAQRTWTRLTVRAHIMDAVSNTDVQSQLAKTLGSWQQEESKGVIDTQVVDEDVEETVRRCCLHIDVSAQPRSLSSVRSGFSRLLKEKTLCHFAKGTRKESHGRILKICESLSRTHSERVDQVDFANQCLTIGRSLVLKHSQLADNLNMIQNALVVAIFGFWPLCVQLRVERFDPSPLLPCCVDPAASKERRLLTLIANQISSGYPPK